jgi:predicted dehydrogenase
MGPYYLSALVHLLGPVVAVTGAASRQRASRVIGSGPRTGEQVPVLVDTHVTGVLHHASGALSTITTSFDAVRTTAAPIEVHGETGTLAVPDPNRFDGDVRLFELGASEWHTVATSAGYADAARGIGLLDMLTAPAPRASGTLALHVLDAMTSLLRSADEGRRIELTTTAERPDPVPLVPAAEWRS